MEPLRLSVTFRPDEDPEICAHLASLSGKARARKVRFLIRKALGLATDDITEDITPSQVPQGGDAAIAAQESPGQRKLGGGLARLGVDPSTFRFAST